MIVKYSEPYRCAVIPYGWPRHSCHWISANAAPSAIATASATLAARGRRRATSRSASQTNTLLDTSTAVLNDASASFGSPSGGHRSGVWLCR
ncbi:Uncharacterised protein [Burkholderia pseudomallei]|nr:Uncharacterised protein [Burkholderia pseudomallei]